MGSIAFAPDNRTLAYGTRHEQIVIWDLVEKAERARVPGRHSERAGALCFLPDGRLAVGDTAGVIKVWELTNNEPNSTPGMVNSDEESVVSSLSVSPKDNSTLAAAYREEGQVIRFWNSRTGDLIWPKNLQCWVLPRKHQILARRTASGLLSI